MKKQNSAHTHSICALILAAGRGRRMGISKALLDWKGQSFLEHQLSAYRACGVRTIVVVANRDVIDALSHLKQKDFVFVEGLAEESQFGSLKRGLLALKQYSFDAVFCGPVDQGPMDFLLLKQLLKDMAWDKSCVRVPVFQRKSGHPILIGKDFLPLISEEPKDGLRGLLEEQIGFVEEVEVETRMIHRNLNHPEQFEQFLLEQELLGD